jgi:hypothetical protein
MSQAGGIAVISQVQSRYGRFCLAGKPCFAPLNTHVLRWERISAMGILR